VSIPIIAFFNNKGGVGQTSLVYHLSWMFRELGSRVLAADLDPQANLSSAFVDDDRLEEIWRESGPRRTVYGCLQPQLDGTGDIAQPRPEFLDDGLGLLVGDLSLAGFEGELSSQWPACLDRNARAFRVISAFWRILQRAASDLQADLILTDLGPNLGPINRSALVASDYVVIPLSPDLFSLQGLRNLGPVFRRWREEWTERLTKKPAIQLDLPAGKMQPVGYIVLQHSVRLDRPVKSYEKWISRIPSEYRKWVLATDPKSAPTVQDDRECLALLKHYRSLMPMAQEVRKPMFHLKAADGAIGAHWHAAQDAFRDFQSLAFGILRAAGLPAPAGAPL